MTKKSSKKTATPETIWLYVPGLLGQPDKVAPREFGYDHAMNILNTPKNGGWVEFKPADKISSNAVTDRGNQGDSSKADAE